MNSQYGVGSSGTRKSRVSLGIGIALLLAAFAMFVLGRERADGSAYIRLPGWMFGIYPAVCLGFLAFGVALIVTSL
jgi:hypothetical protein